MIVDFQHHYTPPELMERATDRGTVRPMRTAIPTIDLILCSPIFPRMCA